MVKVICTVSCSVNDSIGMWQKGERERMRNPSLAESIFRRNANTAEAALYTEVRHPDLSRCSDVANRFATLRKERES